MRQHELQPLIAEPYCSHQRYRSIPISASISISVSTSISASNLNLILKSQQPVSIPKIYNLGPNLNNINFTINFDSTSTLQSRALHESQSHRRPHTNVRQNLDLYLALNLKFDINLYLIPYRIFDLNVSLNLGINGSLFPSRDQAIYTCLKIKPQSSSKI